MKSKKMLWGILILLLPFFLGLVHADTYVTGLGVSDDAVNSIIAQNQYGQYTVATLWNTGNLTLTITSSVNGNYSNYGTVVPYPNPVTIEPNGRTDIYINATFNTLATFNGTVEFHSSVQLPKGYTGNPSVPGGSVKFILRVLHPSTFEVSDLNLTRNNITLGEQLEGSVDIKNTGDVIGNYSLILKIDNVTINTTDITLDSGVLQKYNFTYTPTTIGNHTLSCEYLSKNFTVIPVTKSGGGFVLQPYMEYTIAIIVVIVFSIGVFTVRKRIITTKKTDEEIEINCPICGNKVNRFVSECPKCHNVFEN